MTSLINNLQILEIIPLLNIPISDDLAEFIDGVSIVSLEIPELNKKIQEYFNSDEEEEIITTERLMEGGYNSFNYLVLEC